MLMLLFGKSPSPDGSGILFPASLAGKRYSGQQEKAPGSNAI
jgi:hypothetical protein